MPLHRLGLSQNPTPLSLLRVLLCTPTRDFQSNPSGVARAPVPWHWRRQFYLLGFLCLAALSLQAAAPTRFGLIQTNGFWRLAQRPDQPFFSIGVCVVTQGQNPAQFDPENPGYASWRQYPNPEAWAAATRDRLTDWGFTTLGAWSDLTTLQPTASSPLYAAPVLHLGSTVGAPWWDMWDETLVQRMDAAAREQILALRKNPQVIGYFSDNELGWWNATLWKMTLEHAPGSGQRRRLIQLLREAYANDWSRLRQDFDPENARNWRELERGGMLYLRPGGHGIRVQRQFLKRLASRYYQVVHGLIRKYDPKALVLGDRYQSFYYPEVVEAAAPWVDVLSCNVNAAWSDGTFLRSQLSTLHTLSKKPIWVSEFYLAARENRSGNRNSHGIFPTVETQAQRATSVARAFSTFQSLPYVVAADWFQYFDEPRHGRADGENFNFGLVDIQDRPYEAVVNAFQANRPPSVPSTAFPQRPDASTGIPRAPANPFADFTPSHALLSWDREQGFVQPVSENPLADLYACWDASGIYLGLYALDVTESAFYRDQWVPKQDRALWTVRVDRRHSFHARIGAGREAIPSQDGLRIENLSGVNMSVRNIAALHIPARDLGRSQLSDGESLELDIVFSSHLQTYTVHWRGNFTLRR